MASDVMETGYNKCNFSGTERLKMCGICGQFNFGSNATVDKVDIAEMTSAIAHRGPDDEGYFMSGNVGLGFRRLSIIDLNGGHQPMSDPQETVWVCFNGEIYNFQEVRAELEGFGYRFRTNSDTEVIVHGYKHWGDEVLEHLNGMFGLAIWDTLRKRLILARDRMGIKFIYYKLVGDRLYFGSEMRAILAVTENAPTIDTLAINHFLRYRYTPAPRTIIDGIRKLAPGTCLIAEQGEQPQLKRWWNYSPTPFDRMPSDRDATDQLEKLYSDATERHLISDVPVGLFLSGGVDSALLLSFMRDSADIWKTYTVGYGESFRDDELKDADRTAQLMNCELDSVQITSAEFESTLEGLTAVLEEPVATSSVVPMHYLCKRARQDVKVVLMGQGPDELFGGYLRHLGVNYGSYWRSLPASVRSLVKHACQKIPRNETVHRALYSLDVKDRLHRYQEIFSLFSGESISAMFRDGVIASDEAAKVPEEWEKLALLSQGIGELGGFQFLEIRSSLPDELLLYGDKISMAHSLELRVPYLDKEIVEYVERLDSSFKVRNGERKWLHRRVAEARIPAEVMRRKKRGFASNVVDAWFRRAMSRRLTEILNDSESLIYMYLRQDVVRKYLTDHEHGRADNHKLLFSLIVLEHVLRYYRTVPSRHQRMLSTVPT